MDLTPKKQLDRGALTGLLRRALDVRYVSRGIRFSVTPLPNCKAPNWSVRWDGEPSPAQVKEAETVLTELQREFDLRN